MEKTLYLGNELAKARIRDAHIPYEVPSAAELPARLESVLQVVYLVCNEGYFASSGESLMRPNLSGEAIHLGKRLVEMTTEPEAAGLLALMLPDDALLHLEPSPIIELNRAVAVAVRDGPEAGLSLIEALLEHRELTTYPFLHTARAELYRRNGQTTQARYAYRQALALMQQIPEQRLLKRSLAALETE